MPRPEYMNLSLRKERYELLKKEFGELNTEETKGVTFTEWVGNELTMSMSKLHFLKRYAPAFSFIGVHHNSILIKDDKLQAIAQIRLRGNQFHCDIDEGSCQHIRYALMLSALGEIVDIKPKNV